MSLTASRIELAMKCLGAFTLPNLNERNQWSDGGTERHAEDEEAIGRGDIPTVLEDAWPGYEWRAEVAFAYDVATGEARELGQGLKRNYGPLGPFEIAGASDAVGRKGSHLVIVDKKSYDDVTRAAENPQVRFLALAASKVYKPERTTVATTHLIRGLDQADLEAFDFEETAHAVRQVLLDIARVRKDAREGREVPFATGRQCRWCPAFMAMQERGDLACPEQRELVTLIKSESISTIVEMRMPINDDAAAAEMYELWKRIGMLHKRIGASIFARAAERPFPIGRGKMFGKVTSQGNEKLDGDIVYEVVKAKYGQTIADTAVTRSAAKTRLREALGFVGAKSVAAAEREVLEEVRKRGGAMRTTKEAIEEFVPQLKVVNQ